MPDQPPSSAGGSSAVGVGFACGERLFAYRIQLRLRFS